MSDAKREHDRREEEGRISHAIHGVAPEILGGGGELKGVTIMGRKGVIDQSTDIPNKGVEIITPRHGHKDSRRSGT